MIIDTHAHLNFNAYKNDRDETMKRALDEHIWIINVGSQYTNSQRAVEIAEKYSEGVFAAIGLHPIHLVEQKWHEKVDKDEEFEVHSRAEEFDPEIYRKLAESKKVVAVGEIGLDYFHTGNNKEQQKKTFEKQIDFAVEMNLPIMVHCRKAHDDAIEILHEKKNVYGEKLKGVIHCFSGRLSQAKIYAEEMGFYLGFNGIITFDRSYDKVLKGIDLKYMLTETDCPYLTPIPFRGKRNEPLYVKYVAEKIAKLNGISVEEVKKRTTEGARRLFKI